MVIVGDVDNPLLSMDRSSRQVNQETSTLNDKLDQMDLTDYAEYSIPKQKNIHSFQSHIEHSPGWVIC